MERIKIRATKETPRVLFDGNKGILKIKGKSISEDPRDFYKEIIDGINEYKKSPKGTLEVTIDLEYFNTPSALMILHLFRKLKKAVNFKVIWVYEKDDEDMQQAGEDFEDILKTVFFEYNEIER